MSTLNNYTNSISTLNNHTNTSPHIPHTITPLYPHFNTRYDTPLPTVV